MRVTCLGLLLIWLAACTPPAVEAPSNLVEKEKMAQMLADIHLAEARVSRLALTSPDSTRAVFNKLQSDIFKKYSVDTATYGQSYRYYAADPDQFAQIYQQVLKRLEADTAKRAARKPVLPRS